MNDLCSSVEACLTQKKGALSLVSENIAVISLFASFTTVICSTVFLYAYLAVFDWHLIWTIEYTDILKVGLVMVALVTALQFTIRPLVEQTLTMAKPDSDEKNFAIRLLLLFLFILFAPLFLHDETNSDHHYLVHFHMLFSVVLFIVVVWTGSRVAPRWKELTVSNWVSNALLLIFLLFLLGQTFGYYTKDFGGFNREVHLRSELFNNAAVVMITSHHTIFYTDDERVISAPTSDVVKIVYRGNSPAGAP